jgi:hypothetical protein
MPERRKTIRFRAAAPIVVQCLDSRVAVALADLGAGGFSLRTPSEFAVGSTLRFRFSTPDGSWATLLSAQAVYVRPDPDAQPRDSKFLAGFKFNNLELPRVAASVNALIDRATTVISFS